MYIKLSMFLFFIWFLDLILVGANPLLGPLEWVGPENLDFLGPNGTRFAGCNFKIIMSRAIQTTGTLKVLSSEMDQAESRLIR
jgi:hypothetical protein